MLAVLLIHARPSTRSCLPTVAGASAEILGIINYWNRIPSTLEDEGADVYITSVNGMDSTVNKALAFKQQFLQIKAVTGAAKLNIIGHSHGTIYTRYAISNLGLSSYVASYTSIAGPHRGSAIADVIMGVIPNPVKPLVGAALDFVYAFIFGDSNPNSVQNGYDLVRSYMINTFNPNTPNKSSVYYQSWAARSNDGDRCPQLVFHRDLADPQRYRRSQ